ncbi:MAG: RNA methyltransferase [Candidatus Omnitrophica bacterium]|nr:RNA methyltransferase [Candidatus Omnitrophota bacterium]
MPALNIVEIQNLDDPRLAAYSSLKGKKLEKDGIFIAEGEKVVRSMFESGCRVASCLTSNSAAARYKTLLAVLAKRGADIYAASDEVIENIIGFRFHKGIMAVGHCPEKLTISDALKAVKPPLFLVALDSVNDPQNVGLITRNAAAFGVRALIVDGATYDPYYRKAVRVSMGTIFGLPVCYEKDIAKSLSVLKKKYGVRVIAATPGKSARDIAKVKLSGNICFVFGNEDRGVSRKILNMADEKVRIPIKGGVDSLNVASACAICLHEVSRGRQRGLK